MIRAVPHPRHNEKVMLDRAQRISRVFSYVPYGGRGEVHVDDWPCLY